MDNILFFFVKLFYVAFLFSAFLTVFGIPNINKYLDDESVVVESKEYSFEPMPAPAITVCPFNPNFMKISGWKTEENETFSGKWFERTFSNICRDASDSEVVKCLFKKSYTLQESIIYLKLGSKPENTTGHFKSEIFFNDYGQCHTLMDNFTLPKYGASSKNLFQLNLNKSLQLEIQIYDAKYFYPSKTPARIPGFRVNIPVGSGKQVSIFNVKVIKYIKRNTAASPCSEDDDYSFTDCLKEKVEQEVGCSLPWANSSTLVNCNNRAQFDAYNRIHTEVFDEMNSADIAKKFGCTFPCRYKEYVLVEEIKLQKKSDFMKHVRIFQSTNEILVKKEEPYYGLNSLVGDIGGSLGLFLGFSFWMLIDWAFLVAELVKNLVKSI